LYFHDTSLAQIFLWGKLWLGIGIIHPKIAAPLVARKSLSNWPLAWGFLVFKNWIILSSFELIMASCLFY
jgi:hypothetical protein